MSSAHPRQPTSEKERVYAELDALRAEAKNLRRRVADQRNEINQLKRTGSAKENAVLRREATEYRKALSNIKYRVENGETGVWVLAGIAEKALLLRGLKAWQREEIEDLYA